MTGKSDKTNEANNRACFDDDLLYRYLEKMTTSEEEERIEQHLNECNHCFADVTALTEIIQTPITEIERIEIARSRQTTPEQQVQNILDYVAQENAAIGQINVGEAASAPTNISQSFLLMLLMEIYQRRRRVLQYGVALVALLAIVGGSWRAIGFYQTGYRISQAKLLMQEHYKVSVPDQEPRLSGEYAPTGLGTLMGPAQKKRPYLVQAFKLAEGAIANGYKDANAKQLLAQIYILNGEYARADSILQQLKQAPSALAAALNDLGVIHFSKKDWTRAALFFAAAIEANPQIKEARYNLALAKIEMGETAGVVAILDDYIKLETVDGWKDAARKLKNNLP